jgi:hypothetical protein
MEGADEMVNQSSNEPDWRHEMAREDAHRAHDQLNDFFKQQNESAIKSSETTLRACLLINGGAAVSVLAFIGGLVSKELIGVAQLKPVADSLVLFACGVVAAVCGMGLSYLVHYLTLAQQYSQTTLWESPWQNPGKHTKLFSILRNLLHALAALAAVASVVFFLFGIFAVRDAVEHIPPPATHAKVP